jgi:hypothetical protein
LTLLPATAGAVPRVGERRGPRRGVFPGVAEGVRVRLDGAAGRAEEVVPAVPWNYVPDQVSRPPNFVIVSALRKTIEEIP